MKSAWLIRFKTGYKVILSENAYEQYKKETPSEYVEVEKHWFSMDQCVKENPDANIID